MIGEDIVRYNYGSASVLEIAWTILGILGLAFTIQGLSQCLADRAALLKSAHYIKRGARDVIARYNIRNMVQRVTIFVAIIVVGTVAMLSTPINTKAGPSPYAATLSGAFLIIELIMVAGAFWDRGDRAELYFQVRVRRADGLPQEITPEQEEAT